MMQFITDYNLLGLLTGLATFFIIGIFHPIVVKTEYYTGTRFWWVFLVAGIIGIVGAVLIKNQFLSTLVGVLAFTCLWTIKELFEQRERVLKGWFPKNPKRNDY